MAGMIPQGFIDDLLARVSVVEVISTRVPLKKSGATYKACCPFHQEKTPSFHVNPQKNFYHCFGCGVNGNSINFLREHDNLSFTEAVEELARIAGVEVPRDERVQKIYDAQKRLHDVSEFAALQYQSALQSHATRQLAQTYIEKRGLSAELVERYAIGFAPAERNFLSAKARPDQLKSLIDLKLVSAKYERPFDLFQNRLMFPIRNARGKTIAFGGRTLGDDKAKYINSPESELFHKSSEIYGLYEASKTLRNLDRLLVVEGYMDVVSLAQFGIAYAVATLGTATNNESLSQLLKRCDNLIFCFDGDAAGLNAARKAMENLLPLFGDGMRAGFLILPQGEDPDTLVRKEGREAFERRIDNALPLSEFFFQVHCDGLDLNIAEQKGLLRSKVKPILDGLPQSSLKSGLWDTLLSLTSANRFKKKNETPSMQRDMQTASVSRDVDVSFCVSLYFHPAIAERILSFEDKSASWPKAHAFARYILDKGIQDQQDLLLSLAQDREGHREEFERIFSGVEHLPNEAEAAAEAESTLARFADEKKRQVALRAARLNKLPSQMTPEERQELSSITARSTE